MMNGVSNPSAISPAASAALNVAIPSAAPSAVAAQAPRRPLVGGGVAGGPPGTAPPGRPAAAAHGTQPSQTTGNPTKAMEQMMAQQQVMSLLGVQAQLLSAEINTRSQQIGALAATAVQTFTDQAHIAKDGIKAQGEAFAKAN